MTIIGQCEHCGMNYESKEKDLKNNEYIKCKHCGKKSQNWNDGIDTHNKQENLTETSEKAMRTLDKFFSQF